jgi:hypothetical protein
MTAGRKPKPTNLKLIQDTYRRDRANPSEPKPQAVIPPCPEFLQGEARKQYQKTVLKVSAGTAKIAALAAVEVGSKRMKWLQMFAMS